VAQAKNGFALAHAAHVEYVLARRRGVVALDGGRGSCGDHGGGRPRPRRAVRPCLLPVRRGLASGFKGAKRIKHTRRAAEYSCEDPLGDSNGSGGGGGGRRRRRRRGRGFGQRRHQGRGVTAVRGRHDGAAAVDNAAAAVTATASTSGGFPRGF